MDDGIILGIVSLGFAVIILINNVRSLLSGKDLKIWGGRRHHRTESNLTELYGRSTAVAIYVTMTIVVVGVLLYAGFLLVTS